MNKAGYTTIWSQRLGGGINATTCHGARDGATDGLTDGLTDGRTDGQTDGRTDGPKG